MMAFSAPTTLALNSFSLIAALIIGASETLENHDISMALRELHSGDVAIGSSQEKQRSVDGPQVTVDETREINIKERLHYTSKRRL